MRRHIKRRVLSMIPSVERTVRGNPRYWTITYDCGHEERRTHYGHFPALAGVLSKGFEVKMACGKCG